MKTKRIRVINNSEHSLSRVSLFSMNFEDLNPKDTSQYKEFDYDPLKDDALIYCVVNKKNMGRYLEIPNKEVLWMTYVIDSLKNDIVYVSSKIDK
ncbi:hypothetical protein [Flagellimonas pacifica]|nr:hypothetical protein [Allomuricauda parva]